MPERIDVCLVTGGRWHDIDFARLELLKLLAEHEHVRVKTLADYEDTASITAAPILVSYTCDVRPSDAAQSAVTRWVEGGGRWLALHGTNSALDLPRPNGVEAPRCFPQWAQTLGSQFVAHPPIQPYEVSVAPTATSHWLVEGITAFSTDDELYLCEYHDREALEPLLLTTWSGEAKGFNESDWSIETAGTDKHLVSYLRPLGKGSVLYNTLGHCRGHYDMVPLRAYYPAVERCSWNEPQYYELLRRGIRWALESATAPTSSSEGNGN
jgi:uncharacterized protein